MTEWSTDDEFYRSEHYAEIIRDHREIMHGWYVWMSGSGLLLAMELFAVEFFIPKSLLVWIVLVISAVCCALIIAAYPLLKRAFRLELEDARRKFFLVMNNLLFLDWML